MVEDDFEDIGDFDEVAMEELERIESDFLRNGNKNVPNGAGATCAKHTLSSKSALDNDDSLDFDDSLEDHLLIQHVEETEKRMQPPIEDNTRALASSSSLAIGNPPVRQSLFTQRPRSTAAVPEAPSSKPTRTLQRTSSSSARQMTLFGDILPLQPTQGVLIQANKPNSAIGPATQQSRTAIEKEISTIFGPSQSRSTQRGKTKQWDFSQPILKKTKLKCDPDGELDEWDENFDEIPDAAIDAAASEFDRAPEPVQAHVDTLTSMKVQIDREAAKTWIYPTNKEKRDYQFNIVQRALFNNVLVALPTGLGKTFIAAVVILNYFRWFPQGKIIFVAPTKPLVGQQQLACHGICGLPWDTACEMTGEVRAALRAEEWKSKRIFYMTPQTFENDLCSSAVDAHDVVCIVVDEAHRATGNYAYGKVIRHLMQRNPFFRVLALTATPGSNSDKVQEVVDSLHINLIEIRQEDALDIRKYVHAKGEDPVVVPLSGIVAEMRDKLASLMRPHMEKLAGASLLNSRDAASLAPFAVRSIYKDPRKRDIVAKRKLYQTIKDLANLATAMESLVKYSVTMFASRMWGLETGISTNGTKASTKREQTRYQSNTIVRAMRKLYEECQDAEGFVPHPKMDYLQNVVAAHFAQHSSQEDHSGARQTRVMVFCSYRECVMEIVALLNRLPAVKATQFVGQSTDTKGNRGLRQKDQERIVQEFKRGDFNVLVATSIGEEGLDIGEVDLIVCYEAVKNAVRMLQRVGRTGRKREGRIVVLMAEGPEERNWQQSKDQYKTIQHDIIRGINLSLFDDVDRLVPADISSLPVEMEVDQPAFEPSMIRESTARSRRGCNGKESKRVRNSDPLRNVPAGAKLGFVAASNMRKGKGKGKGIKVALREGDDEDVDHEEGPSSRSVMDEDVMPILNSISDSEHDSDSELERGLTIGGRPIGFQIASTSKPRGRTLGAGRKKPSPEIASPRIPPSTLVLESSQDHDADNGVNILYSSSPVRQVKRIKTAPLSEVIATNPSVSDEEDVSDDSKNDSPIVARGAKRKYIRRAEEPASLSSGGAGAGTMGPPKRSAAQVSKKAMGRGAKTKTKKRIGASPSSRRLFHMEADRSTDEERHGERDEHDEGDDRYVEDSSDLEHVGDFAPTQAPKGYRQQAIYLQSLQTQTAPAIFGSRGRKQALGARHGDEGGASRSSVVGDRGARTAVPPLSSDARTYGDSDEYEKGSFICSDEDIEFDSDVDGKTTAMDSDL